MARIKRQQLVAFIPKAGLVQPLQHGWRTDLLHGELFAVAGCGEFGEKAPSPRNPETPNGAQHEAAEVEHKANGLALPGWSG